MSSWHRRSKRSAFEARRQQLRLPYAAAAERYYCNIRGQQLWGEGMADISAAEQTSGGEGHENRPCAASRAADGLTFVDPSIRIVAEIGAVTRQWQAAMDGVLREHGLTHVRWVTLWRIAESDMVLNQTDLARKVGIEGSTLVRQLDALEERGLIERVVDRDRRARLIRMTPAAVPVIELIKGLATDLGREILTDIDPARLDECATLLHIMRERLRDHSMGCSEPAAG